VFKVLKEQMVPKELQVFKEKLVHRVSKELKEQKEPKVFKVP
jgi:hypothetical protein